MSNWSKTNSKAALVGTYTKECTKNWQLNDLIEISVDGSQKMSRMRNQFQGATQTNVLIS